MGETDDCNACSGLPHVGGAFQGCPALSYAVLRESDRASNGTYYPPSPAWNFPSTQAMSSPLPPSIPSPGPAPAGAR